MYSMIWYVYVHNHIFSSKSDSEINATWFQSSLIHYSTSKIPMKSKILLSKPEAEFKELHISFLKGRKNMIVSDPPSKESNTWLTTVPLIKYELYINVLFVSTVYFHLRVFCKSDLRAFSALESPNGKTHGTKNFKVRVRKTTISSIFIIRLRFQEYHFKSGIVFFAQNYTHGPLITLTVH